VVPWRSSNGSLSESGVFRVFDCAAVQDDNIRMLSAHFRASQLVRYSRLEHSAQKQDNFGARHAAIQASLTSASLLAGQPTSTRLTKRNVNRLYFCDANASESWLPCKFGLIRHRGRRILYGSNVFWVTVSSSRWSKRAREWQSRPAYPLVQTLHVVVRTLHQRERGASNDHEKSAQKDGRIPKSPDGSN